MAMIKTFKLCVISAATDSREDGDNHFIKLGEVAAEAVLEIARPISRATKLDDSSNTFSTRQRV